MPCQEGSAPVLPSALFPFVRLLGILGGFVQCSASVIAGPLGEPVFVQRPVALPRHVENLSQVDVSPNLGPLRVEVAGQSRPKFVGRADVVLVRVSEFTNSEVNQGTSLICFEGRPALLNGITIRVLA